MTSLQRRIQALGGWCADGGVRFKNMTMHQAWDVMTWEDFEWLVTRFSRSDAPYLWGVLDTAREVVAEDRLRVVKTVTVFTELSKLLRAR